MTSILCLTQVREHELDEEKAEADANNSNALAGELVERKRTLEQWSVAAYGEVPFPRHACKAMIPDINLRRSIPRANAPVPHPLIIQLTTCELVPHCVGAFAASRPCV